MAKALQFELAGRLFESEPVKLDRKKIYGHKEIAAFDADGKECTQCQLDAAGELLIPSGAVKIVSLDEDGNSIERDEMILTDAQGNSPENHPSSFEAPLVLNEKEPAVLAGAINTCGKLPENCVIYGELSGKEMRR